MADRNIESNTSVTAKSTADPNYDLYIECYLPLTKELACTLWTQTKHTDNWSFPKGFSLLHNEADVRCGGFWKLVMRSSEGIDYTASGYYVDIRPPERLIYSFAWHDEHDQPGLITLCKVYFEDDGDGTLIKFNHLGLASHSAQISHLEGWKEIIDRLTQYAVNFG